MGIAFGNKEAGTVVFGGNRIAKAVFGGKTVYKKKGGEPVPFTPPVSINMVGQYPTKDELIAVMKTCGPTTDPETGTVYIATAKFSYDTMTMILEDEQLSALMDAKTALGWRFNRYSVSESHTISFEKVSSSLYKIYVDGTNKNQAWPNFVMNWAAPPRTLTLKVNCTSNPIPSWPIPSPTYYFPLYKTAKEYYDKHGAILKYEHTGVSMPVCTTSSSTSSVSIGDGKKYIYDPAQDKMVLDTSE